MGEGVTVNTRNSNPNIFSIVILILQIENKRDLPVIVSETTCLISIPNK